MKVLVDPECTREECFGNSYGKCKILIEKIQGRPCPFFKTTERYVKERIALDEGDMMAYKMAALKDQIREIKHVQQIQGKERDR